MTSYTPYSNEAQPARIDPPAKAPHEVLLKLLQVEREVRQAEDFNALKFTIVNSLRQLLEYQQAILWTENQGVLAISGLAEVDKNVPFVRWFDSFMRQHAEKGELKRSALNPEIQSEWSQWLPETLWREPLKSSPALKSNSSDTTWLILARSRGWNNAEQSLLAELTEAFGHAFYALQPKQHFALLKKRSWIALVVAALIMFIPITQTVMTQVEVIPVDPTMVRVSLDGVIEKFHITPNQTVSAGQPLFDLDPTKLNGSLDVARNALSVAEADYRQVAQQALTDPRAKALLVLRNGDVERKQSELAYLEQLNERLKVKSPVDGVAVLSDVNDWLGRSVSVGEKVLDIADPSNVEFQIHLPVQEMIPLPENAKAEIFLNISPDNPLPAAVHYQSYQAEATADGVLAYRLKASLPADVKPPRVGLRGVARLYGERVAFGYWLFRRPISWLRQWTGAW